MKSAIASFSLSLIVPKPQPIANFKPVRFHRRSSPPALSFRCSINPNPKPLKMFRSLLLLPFFNLFRSSFSQSSPSSAMTPQIHVKETIELSEKEQLIFNRLLQVVKDCGLSTELRVAGGWVRDKLLGKDSHDIDIAIDNMMGREFCEKINEHLTSTGEAGKGFSVIRSNPDQSKHLETARMRIYGVEIDFVNLRAEDYCSNSRIPTSMRFGTAKEDAERRDLTINSLFYNINRSSVEDPTGKGIADLKDGRIVTPLPPKNTFLDDPLRVLRAIRFGARFGFVLDDELKKAASCTEVRNAMVEKISRDRIGHEIDLMVSGNNPVKAMTYISELSLFPVVFTLPPNSEVSLAEEFERLGVLNVDAVTNLLKMINTYSFDVAHRRLSFYAALLLPLRKSTYANQKSREVPVVDYIFRDSLKLKADDGNAVIKVHNAAEKFVSLIPYILLDKDIDTIDFNWGRQLIDMPHASRLRVYTGLLLDDIKDLWRVSLLVSTLLYPNSLTLATNMDSSYDLSSKRDLFTATENEVVKLGLEEVGKGKLDSLVDGKSIMNALGLVKGSPATGEWVHKVRQWQLAHPLATKEECIEWIKESQSKRQKIIEVSTHLVKSIGFEESANLKLEKVPLPIYLERTGRYENKPMYLVNSDMKHPCAKERLLDQEVHKLQQKVKGQLQQMSS